MCYAMAESPYLVQDVVHIRHHSARVPEGVLLLHPLSHQLAVCSVLSHTSQVGWSVHLLVLDLHAGVGLLPCGVGLAW